MPVIIGEYHFGALDRGMTATGLRGVTPQEYKPYTKSVTGEYPDEIEFIAL